MNFEQIRNMFSFSGELIFMILFSALFFVAYFSKRFDRKIFDTISAAVIFLISILIVFEFNTGSTFMYYFVLSFVMISVIYILNFVKLNILEYSILFSIIILFDRFCLNSSYFFGRTMYVCTIFLSILFIYKIKLKNLKGNIFNMWFTFITTVIEGYFFELIFENFVRRQIAHSFYSTVTKVLVWGVSAVIVVAVNLALIYILKKTFSKYFYEINEMGKKYPAIEKYFIYISMGVLLMIMLIHLGYTLINGYSMNMTQLLTIFCMFALILQLVYLTLLFRVTYLKENLFNKEQENQSLALYSSNLEKNIDDIKNIKHDIKNIFFTMGQYVEDSGDEEMKLFYKTKIYPFATDEIIKNDLHVKLMGIGNEQLKAFLFYKISQGLERNINTELDIDLKSEGFIIAIDFTDLIRILGILIDNAIEECVNIPKSKISIKISQNSQLTSYTIKNTVEPTKKEKGIKKGVSTKGENRGNGLMIVQSTLEKYDFVMLNSLFKEDMFVQNLNIYFES